MKPIQEQLVKYGSIEGACAALGETARGGLTEAMHELTMMCPEVMRGSPEHVVGWARLQYAWEQAFELGDTKEMRAVEKQREDMLMRLH